MLHNNFDPGCDGMQSFWRRGFSSQTHSLVGDWVAAVRKVLRGSTIGLKIKWFCNTIVKSIMQERANDDDNNDDDDNNGDGGRPFHTQACVG